MIVDDVYTTGTSFKEYCDGIIYNVLITTQRGCFSRVPTEDSVSSLFECLQYKMKIGPRLWFVGMAPDRQEHDLIIDPSREFGNLRHADCIIV